MDFKRDLGNQQLSWHQSRLAAMGFETTNIADDRQRLRDLFDARTGTFFECKTDSHYPRNACVELVANVYALPREITERSSIQPHERERYEAAIRFMKQTGREHRNRLSLGLSPDLEENHYLSYGFPSYDSHFCASIKQLQNEIIFPRLALGTLPLVWSESRDGSRQWYSLSALVPVGAIAELN
jgi:hypothetical protein